MGLVAYAARRFVATILVLLLVSFIIFTIAVVIPSDAAYLWTGDTAPPASAIQAMHVKYHLDDPFYVRYFYYMNTLFHGDLGVSPRSGRPIIDDFKDYLPNTIQLGGFALTLSIIVGVPLGIVSAKYRNKMPDHLSRLFALGAVSMPLFWLGLLFQLIFYYDLGWMRDPGGRISESAYLFYPIKAVTGFYLVDAILTGNWPALFDGLQHIIMPGICLALLPIALITRLMRSSMLEALEQDYVRTARAYGFSERIVVYKHALRNALVPTVTIIGIVIGWLLTGSVIVETIFYFPGIGKYAVDSIFAFDFPGITAFVEFSAVIFILSNLVIDILYGVIDPRIRA